MYFKAFALTGRIADCLIPRALPWAKGFCPFRACCLYGLLARQGIAAYMGCLDFRALLSHANFAEFSSCMVEITQHALKGQKLLAQGNALGINDIQLTPCKGKSFKIMAQSLSKIYIHLIFHIKSTSPKIRENDLGRLHQYIGKLVKTSGCTEIKAGGIGDHVHVLFILSKDVTISQIVEEIKRNSSRWIKDFDPVYYRFFAWQGGYAAYSISQSVVDKTLQYIDNQKEHHARHSFAEEYKAFLDLYKVEYDEKFVFRD